MSKILFVQNIRFEQIGLMSLSACLKAAGHDCQLFIGSSLKDVERALRRYQPDVLGFSLMSGMHLWANALVADIRKLDLPKRPFIIYGGPHPTFFPGVLEASEIDAICIGEGEGAIVDLANSLARGETPRDIPNLRIRTPDGISETPVRILVKVDELPMPDRGLYYKLRFFRSEPTKSFMTGRGCPYNCTFCYNAAIRELYRGKGSFVRQRAPELIVEEILDVKQRWGLKTVIFYDDTFGLDKDWTLRFLSQYQQKIGLPFLCRIRANSADDELIGALKAAGCDTVFFAIETANEILREKVLRKHVRDSDIRLIAKALQRHRIRFLTYNMVGIPDQSIEDIYATIRLNIEIGTNYPWCSIFAPYPGTELGTRCIEKGLLPADFGPNDLATTYHRAAFVGKDDADEVANLHKFFQLAVLVPSLFPLLKRMAKWRPNPFFTAIFAGVYFINYLRSERRALGRTLLLAYHNMADLLGRPDE
jgi:radical SAM superfamily enzyme YgiQ (UPF0313 family)